MILLWRELQVNWRSLVVWSVSFASYNVLMFLIYPTIADMSLVYSEIMKALPREMLLAFNIHLDFADNILSFAATYTYLYFLLAGSIYAMILGASILSKEENDKTIEFLLAKPITRSTIVTAKMLCVAINVFLFNAFFALSTFVLMQIYQRAPYNIATFLWMVAGSLLVLYFFAAFGLALSVFVTKSRAVLSLAMGTVMASFVLGVASEIAPRVHFLRYLSPFEYVDTARLLVRGSIEARYLIIMVVGSGVLKALTYFFYNRKDIR